LMEAGIAGRTARIAAYDTLDVEYVYAKDIGKAIDLAATVPAPKEQVFNIGNGEVTRFEDLIKAVRSVYPKLNIDIEPGEKPIAKSVPMDISRARKLLGWEPRFTLIDALKDYHADLAAAHEQNLAHRTGMVS
jgi:nucleoside-diphosphate-sugar epimerase